MSDLDGDGGSGRRRWIWTTKIRERDRSRERWVEDKFRAILSFTHFIFKISCLIIDIHVFISMSERSGYLPAKILVFMI